MEKEQLKESADKKQEISETIETTRKGLFGLNLDVIKEYFQKALGKIKEFFWFSKDKTKKSNEVIETETTGWNTISEEMFHQLLKMEWSQNFTAKIHKKTFWEDFVTWPYGMVYKHIDPDWNLLKKPIPFKDWEKVSPSWAEKNAKAYYNKKAKQRAKNLNEKWYKYTQNMLDALVSASWWTVSSCNRLKKFVLSHRYDKNAIYNFWLKFARTAAWNGKIMPWLVRRRKFEANRFKGIKRPFSSYKA